MIWLQTNERVAWFVSVWRFVSRRDECARCLFLVTCASLSVSSWPAPPPASRARPLIALQHTCNCIYRAKLYSLVPVVRNEVNVMLRWQVTGRLLISGAWLVGLVDGARVCLTEHLIGRLRVETGSNYGCIESESSSWLIALHCFWLLG